MLSTLPRPTIVLSIPDTVPVNVGEARSALAESEVLNPSILDCAMAAKVEISASVIVPSVIFSEVIEASSIEVAFTPVNPEPSPTNAVAETVPVAEMDPVFMVPVNVGEASGAFRSNAVCVAEEIGLSESEVLSTLPRPTDVLLIRSSS